MNRETDDSPDYGEYKKLWNETMSAEEDRRTCLTDLFSRAEILWRMMRGTYAVTDGDLLAKMDERKRISVYQDQGLEVICSECGRQYTIRDTLRPACVYCGNIPAGLQGHIAFDGSSIFAPFPEWLRRTEHAYMSKTADIQFASPFSPPTTKDSHPAAAVLKGLSALVLPIPIHIGGLIKAGTGNTGSPLGAVQSVNYGPLLDRFCAVLFSIWEIFREKTDAGVESLAEEVFRLLDKLAPKQSPDAHRPPFEYLMVLTDAVRNLVSAAASFSDEDYAKMSDSLAKERAARSPDAPVPVCRVCGRPIQSLKSGPVACIYCGTKIEQDPAAYLFNVRFD